MFVYWFDTMHENMVDEKDHGLKTMLMNHPTTMKSVGLPESRCKAKINKQNTLRQDDQLMDVAWRQYKPYL